MTAVSVRVYIPDVTYVRLMLTSSGCVKCWTGIVSNDTSLSCIIPGNDTITPVAGASLSSLKSQYNMNVWPTEVLSQDALKWLGTPEREIGKHNGCIKLLY